MKITIEKIDEMALDIREKFYEGKNIDDRNDFEYKVAMYLEFALKKWLENR